KQLAFAASSAKSASEELSHERTDSPETAIHGQRLRVGGGGWCLHFHVRPHGPSAGTWPRGGPRSACRNSSSPCAKHQVGWRSTGVELRTIRVLLVRKWKQKLPLGCTIGKSGSIASPLWWPRWTSGPRKWAGPPVAWKRDLMMHGSASTGFQPCSFSKTLAGLYSNRLGDLPRVPMVWLISTSCRLTTTSPATTTTTASGISITIRSAEPTLWIR